MSLENKITDYKENEKDILHWVLLKGEYRYEEIISFMEKNEIECTWENVTNYVKYDKRLLINSFKYIVFLEELFKSYIFEKEKNNIAVDMLLKMEFKPSLEKFLKLVRDDDKYMGMDIKTLRQEKDLINDFRNSVVHNKILLGRMFENKDNNYKKNLDETIKIIFNIIPLSHRDGFLKDIKNCRKGLIKYGWCLSLKY